MRPEVRALVVCCSIAVGCSSEVSVPPPPSPVERPAVVTSPNGQTVHVDATAAAGGGDGSVAAPFATLAEGLEELEAGDTLVVAGGTYRERIDLREPARGTPAEPITVIAAEGERPIVKGLFWLRDLEHWVIDGINVTWDPDVNSADEHMVKFTGGANWVYRNSEVWDARSYAGILVAGDPVDFRLEHLYVHDTAPSNGKNEDHLIYLNSGTGGGVVERNLLVGSPNGRGVKVGPASPDGDPIANVQIRYNTMVDNLGPSNVQLGWGVSSVLVEGNIMVGAEPGRGNVTAFELVGSDNVVRNNIGWRSETVVEDDPGLTDGGGNTLLDPELTSEFLPGNPSAADYGHAAP
jgi:hypothetical protein